MSGDLQASEIKTGTKKGREIPRMGQGGDKSELNSGKEERANLRGYIWKYNTI